MTTRFFFFFCKTKGGGRRVSSSHVKVVVVCSRNPPPQKNFKKKKKNFPSIWSLDEEIRIFRFWTKKSPSKLWAKRRPLFFDFFPIFQGPRRPRRRTTTLKNKRKKRRKRLKKTNRCVVVGANANETTSRTSALTLKDALFDVCFL